MAALFQRVFHPDIRRSLCNGNDPIRSVVVWAEDAIRGGMEYRAFQIYSTPVPMLRELLGNITQWHPAGTITGVGISRSLNLRDFGCRP